jgi:hypothetical protein
MGVVALDRGHQTVFFQFFLYFLERNWDNWWGEKEEFPKMGKSRKNREISMGLTENRGDIYKTSTILGMLWDEVVH